MTDRELSPSLEDYLEAIYNLKIRRENARVKDIARQMDVTMPSVTGAIRSLAAKGLVRHEPYEYVDLTDEGLDRARSIVHRHAAVKEFLTGVLGLSEEEAEREACEIEHAIRPETLDKLLKFIDFARACSGNRAMKLDDFRHYIRCGEYPPDCECKPPEPGNCGEGTPGISGALKCARLSDLCPGATGRIAFVSGKGPLRKKFMDMGLTPDARFEVVRVAPLGDPIEIRVRGYLLSLRRSEAQHIEVEVDQ